MNTKMQHFDNFTSGEINQESGANSPKAGAKVDSAIWKSILRDSNKRRLLKPELGGI